ncbi:hypothetical protein T265_05048 [Opisthorchis viverrini]|uniref:Uncharacterized protein n=1 Tax=Opisthorchis viverrini TaxID=6198 RepID=A0A074ZQ97_OPIVI|nr:hypothetical protein T265_05047 [Opisthorchis viverrini]XP_009168223.1 hypothetical protein T265_05048 [Opisthorchis viverrini]KER27997.1 hypothetical protein T265_05047 [Opisthorchis viverrini]KER27998.1 hypothetical protein T265_05048 [Opisthorchis viverrini]
MHILLNCFIPLMPRSQLHLNTQISQTSIDTKSSSDSLRVEDAVGTVSAKNNTKSLLHGEDALSVSDETVRFLLDESQSSGASVSLHRRLAKHRLQWTFPNF